MTDPEYKAWWPPRAGLRGSVFREMVGDRMTPNSQEIDPFAQNILRNCKAGLGYRLPIETPSSSRGLVDNMGHNSKQCMFMSWNAGDLDRHVKRDMLLRFVCNNPWHIVCLQEASSELLGMHVQTRGMSIARSEGWWENAIIAGASGVKCIRPLYNDWDGVIDRPWTTSEDPGKRRAMDIFAADVAWLDRPDGSFVKRAGLDVWRVCSVHFHYAAAHKKDSTTLVLKYFFALMIRDRVRVVSGDFNQAWHCIVPALEQAPGGVSYTIHHGCGPHNPKSDLRNPENPPRDSDF